MLAMEEQTQLSSTVDKALDPPRSDAVPEHHAYPHKLVLKLGPNDVLVGRGAPSNANEGNKRFRELVKQRKLEYTNTKKRQTKDQIAKEIVETIATRDGQFLRKLESLTETEQLGVDDKTEAWLIVPKDIAIRKTKQALRDKEVTAIAEDGDSDISAGGAGIDQAHRAVERSYLPDLNNSTAGVDLHLKELLARQQNMASFRASEFPTGLNSLKEQMKTTVSDYHQSNINHAPTINPAIASLLLAQNRLSQQSGIYELNRGRLGSIAAPDGLMSSMLPAFAKSSALSDLALRQGWALPDQQQATADSSIYQRLLAMNASLPARTENSSLGLDSILQTKSIVHIEDTPEASNDELRITKPFMAEHALKLAKEKHKLSDHELLISAGELNLLSVLISHGLPVWRKDDCHKKDEHESADVSDFAWSDFIWSYYRLGSETETSCVISEQELKCIPEQVIMLVEKLVTASKTNLTKHFPTGTKGNMPGTGVDLWFQAELLRWAADLGITDDSRQRPIALSAEDLITPEDALAESSGMIGLSASVCSSIISQAALVTRLRAINLKNPCGMDEQVGLVQNRLVSSQLPRNYSFWEGEKDMLLLEGILERGVTEDLWALMIPGGIDVQAHVADLISCLHCLQAEHDCSSVITRHKGRLQATVYSPKFSRSLKKQKLDR